MHIHILAAHSVAAWNGARNAWFGNCGSTAIDYKENTSVSSDIWLVLLWG